MTRKPPAKKRMKGVQIARPFVYGSTATPLDPSHRPPHINADHTHTWTIYLRPLPPPAPPLHHWLKKVQFKLHETYANSTRTIESPQPFEVTETGWGEFEVQIKLFFVGEAGEKAQTLWHALKLHPWGEDVEGKKVRRESVSSRCYEEVVFSEPVEAFYEILTNPAPPLAIKGAKGGGGKGAGGAKKGAGAAAEAAAARMMTAELPSTGSAEHPFSKGMEVGEIERLREAQRVVEGLIQREKGVLVEKERRMEELRKDGEGKDGGEMDQTA